MTRIQKMMFSAGIVTPSLFVTYCRSGFGQATKQLTASDEIIEPYQISKNPYRLKGHSGILDTKRVSVLSGDGTTLYSPYPGGGLRLEKMLDEHTAIYQVLVGRQDVYPDGENRGDFTR